MKRQFETIGGGKGGDTIMPESVILSKHQDVKTSDIQEMKRQTIYLPDDLAIWLKAHAALSKDDMSGIVTRLVQEYREKIERGH